jgi:signal transduction histidine kinase
VPIAVLAVVVATVLVHGLSRDAATASSWLAAGSLLALLVAWARARAACSRTTRELDQVCARVDETERLLGEDEDTLHEVRTALAGLVLSDRLLQEHDELLDEQTRDRLLHLRERDLDRIQHLLSGGLHHLPPAPEQASRETEQPETEADPAATDDVVDDAADEVPVTALVVDALTAAQLRGEPVEEHGPDLPDATVRAEPHDVAEILDILLRNAARHAPGARVEVDVEPAEHSVCVRVSDEGPGVPEGLRSTLFTRGARGPSSPGSGLGLAVARRLAERNDGALHLETTGPAGTTFALHLPAGGLDDHITQIDHEHDTTTEDDTMPTTDRLVAVPSCHAHSA